jgi:hypothetical protein
VNDAGSLSHSLWDCKYHIVWIPEYCKKAIYDQLRKYLGATLRELAMQKESRIGGTSSGSSCAYVDFYTAEACSVAGSWFHERQECDSNSEEF